MTNDEKTIQTLRFNSAITDEQLRTFFGAENVVKIERISPYYTLVSAYSEEPGEILGKRLEKRFEDWNARKAVIREQKSAEHYERTVKEMYDGVLGQPMNRWNHKTGQMEYGYTFLDPDDNDGNGTWIEVWPTDGSIPKTLPRHTPFKRVDPKILEEWLKRRR